MLFSRLKEGLRNTGISLIGEVPWGTHICGFYQNRGDLLKILLNYFKEGLKNNEYCVWFTSDTLPANEAEAALEAAVPDFTLHRSQGQIKIVPHQDWYLQEGLLNLSVLPKTWTRLINQSLAKGYEGIRMAGCLDWIEEKHWDDFAAYEAVVDKAIAAQSMLALCLYPLDSCGTSKILDLVGSHSFVFVKQGGRRQVLKERKNTEERLHRAHQQLLDIIEFLPDATFVINRDKQVIAWNRAIEKMTGMPQKDIIGRGDYAYAIPFYGERRPIIIDLIFSRSREVEPDYDFIYQTANTLFAETYVPQTYQGKGAHLWATAAPLYDEKGALAGAIETIRDVTQRKQIEQQIRHRLTVEAALAQASGLFVSPQGADLNEVLRVLGQAVSVSRAYIFQFRENGRRSDNTHEWCGPGVKPQIAYLQNRDTSNFPWFMEKLQRGKNIIVTNVESLPGEAAAEKASLRARDIFSLLVVPIFSTSGALTGYMGFDDTEKSREWSPEDTRALRIIAETFGIYREQKRSEEALRESEQKLRDIINHSSNLFYSYNTDYTLTYVSPQARHFLDCEPEAALVRWTDYLTGHPVNILGKAISRRAIETGVPQPVYELELTGSKGRKIWVEVSETPVVRDGKTIAVSGALTDVTERKKAAEELNRSFEKAKKTLEQIVNTLSHTVQTRDPYTAGHQRRVAELACAIGRRMGLSEEQIKGIHKAGLLHDIGKIYIPSEILSRSGDISESELTLIKIHPQVGYDILKDIDFEFPIKEVILQHHERMNGSGYPQGLSGEEILLEARVLAVADVVEAMSSHRPYRAALSIKTALEEITKNRGTLYEPSAVNACLALYEEKNDPMPKAGKSRKYLVRKDKVKIRRFG